MIPKQCPVCNGSGKVMRGSFGDPLKEVPRDCHSCNASGFLKLDADDYKEAITTHLDGTGHSTLSEMRREFDAMRAKRDPEQEVRNSVHPFIDSVYAVFEAEYGERFTINDADNSRWAVRMRTVLAWIDTTRAALDRLGTAMNVADATRPKEPTKEKPNA